MIKDPRFRCEIDWDGSSKSPERGIWRGQHVCVAEGFSPDDPMPNDPGGAVCRHQLKSQHSAHYSVLNFGYLVLHFEGFPHSVMCQVTRHQDSSFLVQSGRYTSQRFLDVADKVVPVEDGFYFRPTDDYQNRTGKRYHYGEADLAIDKGESIASARLYAERIRRGWAEEHAREGLRYNHRQNFAVAGTIEAWFHLLDQRSKADSQREIQALAAMSLERLIEFAPTLGGWYKVNRYGKANLAP
jgi:thymidylate synthase (FAD)